MVRRSMPAWWNAVCRGMARADRNPLEIRNALAYMNRVTSVTMAINGVWNKRCGPGGGTRRLHHLTRPVSWPAEGGETGSTRAVKIRLLPGMVPPSSDQITSANDNSREAVALAA